jgi:hypothetical protein
LHSPNTITAALALAADGANASEIGRRLAVPRGTIRDWLNGRVPRHGVLGDPGIEFCEQCGHPAHAYSQLPQAYVYLLGLYLGDGWISLHQRGVYRLRIALDARYPEIIDAAASAVREVRQGTVRIQRRTRQNCCDVSAWWRSWPCLFPQHGAGRKQNRAIVLTDWQQRLADRWPEQLLRGLIHSDGCRFQNTGRCNWSNPRYSFTNHSDDIRAIFCGVCEALRLHWTLARPYTIYVSRKADVARLDEFIGPKR